ncbi:unnamed protein product, partial [Didymodactylos carnosus]
KELVEPLMAIQDEKISELEDKITQLEASLTDQNLFASKLESSVKISKDKSNHLKQYGRIGNLRIHNVPEIQDENVHNIVMNLATQMKAELDSHSYPSVIELDKLKTVNQGKLSLNFVLVLSEILSCTDAQH